MVSRTGPKNQTICDFAVLGALQEGQLFTMRREREALDGNLYMVELFLARGETSESARGPSTDPSSTVPCSQKWSR